MIGSGVGLKDMGCTLLSRSDHDVDVYIWREREREMLQSNKGTELPTICLTRGPLFEHVRFSAKLQDTYQHITLESVLFI